MEKTAEIKDRTDQERVSGQEENEIRTGDAEEIREGSEGQPTKKRKVAREAIAERTKNWDKQDVSRGIILTLALVTVVIISMLLTKISVLGNAIAALLSAMTPVFIGLAFAYVLNPLHNFLARLLKKPAYKVVKTKARAEKMASAMGLTLTVFLFLGAVIGLLAVLLPQLKESLVSLYDKLPTYVENIRQTLDGWFENSPAVQEVINNYLSNFQNMMSKLFNETLLPNMDTILVKISSGIIDGVSILVNIFVGLIVAIYVLAQKRHLGAQVKKLLFSFCSKKRGNQVLEATDYVNNVFGGFVNGKIVDSLLIGVLTACFCGITNMPYGLLVSVIIAVTNIIPFFGPLIGVVPSGLLILVEEPKMALIFVIFIIVIQQLDANLLQPIVLGDATGLSGLWVLFAITVGSGLFGVVGMILSVPVFAIIYTVFTIFIRHRLKHQELTNSTEYYYDLIGFDDDGNPIRGTRTKKRKSRIEKKLSIKSKVNAKMKENEKLRAEEGKEEEFMEPGDPELEKLESAVLVTKGKDADRNNAKNADRKDDQNADRDDDQDTDRNDDQDTNRDDVKDDNRGNKQNNNQSNTRNNNRNNNQAGAGKRPGSAKNKRK